MDIWRIWMNLDKSGNVRRWTAGWSGGAPSEHWETCDSCMSWRPFGFPVHCCISRVMCLLFFFFGGVGTCQIPLRLIRVSQCQVGEPKHVKIVGCGCKGHHLKNHASIPGSATTLSGHETLHSLNFLVLYVFVFFLASLSRGQTPEIRSFQWWR